MWNILLENYIIIIQQNQQNAAPDHKEGYCMEVIINTYVFIAFHTFI